MTNELTRLLNALDATSDARTPLDSDVARYIADASGGELTRFLQNVLLLAEREAVVDQLLSPVFRSLLQSSAWSRRHSPMPDADTIVKLYSKLGVSSPSRHYLMAILAQTGDREFLHCFAELMATDPPEKPEFVVQASVSLWRNSDAQVEALFPRLMDALQHPVAATVVLDLANYLTVSGRIATHPAAARRRELLELFARLIERLEGYEEASVQQGVNDLQIAYQVAEGVSLAVALCYALSLIKERDAIGRFYRMLDLRHRRLRVEAAAALARMQEKAGNAALVELAAEPSVRLSVLAYAAEIGILDDIAAEHRSPVARAEAELVAKVSDPSYFGFPPGEIELVDTRSLHWPGFDEPMACFLFRFTYSLPMGDLSNIGLAGPGTQVFAADLTVLTTDDVYAAFAGWEADHDEIQQYEVDAQKTAQATEIDQYARAMQGAGFDSIHPEFIGEFFGERSLVAACVRAGERGFVVATTHEVVWIPRGDPRRPLSADMAYAIYKGRKLLRTFNEDSGE